MGIEYKMFSATERSLGELPHFSRVATASEVLDDLEGQIPDTSVEGPIIASDIIYHTRDGDQHGVHIAGGAFNPLFRGEGPLPFSIKFRSIGNFGWYRADDEERERMLTDDKTLSMVYGDVGFKLDLRAWRPVFGRITPSESLEGDITVEQKAVVKRLLGGIRQGIVLRVIAPTRYFGIEDGNCVASGVALENIAPHLKMPPTVGANYLGSTLPVPKGSYSFQVPIRT